MTALPLPPNGRVQPRANPCARNRAVDDPGEVLARRAEVADHLPDGVSQCVDHGLAGSLGHVAVK